MNRPFWKSNIVNLGVYRTYPFRHPWCRFLFLVNRFFCKIPFVYILVNVLTYPCLIFSNFAWQIYLLYTKSITYELRSFKRPYYEWTKFTFVLSYGFLGASGCGKSTVLSILVGKNKLDSGELIVEGGRSDSLHGGKIGYMPQVRLNHIDHLLFFLL